MSAFTYPAKFTAGSDGRILVEFVDLPPQESEPPASADELSGEELATLDAVRASMEKGAMVLRTLVGLCLEKGVFTKDEMAARRRREP